MTTDYSKKTNADLVEILKARSLPHNGKKAELVARLQEDDTKNDNTGSAPATTAKTDVGDDVIDWEDDDVPAEGTAPAKPATETGAAAIAAGGQGQVSNPATVPNQNLDTDPAATDDLKVEPTKAEAAGKEGTETAPAEAAPSGEEGAAGQAEEKSAPNYAKGLPITEMEEELKKRKARAEKFGITEESQTSIAEAEKQLDRAKRFGTGADSNVEVGVKGLDEALPEEKSRKRGRNDREQGGRGGKRRNFGGRNNRPRRQGGNQNKKEGANDNGSKPQNTWSEQDHAAMEARKKRFGAS